MSLPVRSLDANILLRFLLADDPDQSPRCQQLLARIERGEEKAWLPEAALCDVVWTLRGYFRWPTERIRRFVQLLLSLDGLDVARSSILRTAIQIFDELHIDFSDALIAAEALERSSPEVYTFDRDFDRIPGIHRVEP